jgi:hypothetical protein
VLTKTPITYKEAHIAISDAVTGRQVKQLPISLKNGVGEVVYRHGYQASGTYVYSLVIDGETVQSRKMLFAN